MKVSVIIPNYNYCRFLKERLDSIINQTFQDFEIIFLDDASTDESVTFFERYIRTKNIPYQKVVNDINTANPFVQWNRGVALAKGKYVWIAEADDYCSRDFLKTHVEILDENQNVGVSYCQSCHVDDQSKQIGSIIWSVEWLDKERWKKSFINDGQDELKNYLVFQNTIPNASAVVFRKEVYEEIGRASTNYRLMGDWITWMKMLTKSDVAFTADMKNFFRVHTQSIRSEFDDRRRLAYIKELYDFAQEHHQLMKLDDEQLLKVKKHYTKITLNKLKDEAFSLSMITKFLAVFWHIIAFDPVFPARAIKFFLARQQDR